jgi:hypothetical protein
MNGAQFASLRLIRKDSYMDKVRRYLWKQFGVTLDRETKIVGGIVAACVIAAIVFGIFFALTHASFFLLMIVLSIAGAGTIAFGGSYNAMSWGLASKEERKKIEEEIALKQLRRRARDSHYQR